MASGGRGRDPAWEHALPNPDSKQGSICKYCGLVMKGGGVTRLKYHLAGVDPRHNVQRCNSVPPEVKQHITAMLDHKQHQKNKKAHQIEELRAELRGEGHINLSDSDDDVDVDHDDDLEREERRQIRLQCDNPEQQNGTGSICTKSQIGDKVLGLVVVHICKEDQV